MITFVSFKISVRVPKQCAFPHAWQTLVRQPAPSAATLQRLYDVVPYWWGKSVIWVEMAMRISDWLITLGYPPLDLKSSRAR